MSRSSRDIEPGPIDPFGRGRGVRVRVLAPTQQDLQVMSYNVMDPTLRRAVLSSARQTTVVPPDGPEVTAAAR